MSGIRVFVKSACLMIKTSTAEHQKSESHLNSSLLSFHLYHSSLLGMLYMIFFFFSSSQSFGW